MKVKAVSILLLSVLVLGLVAAAEDSPAYNLMVSDQSAYLIAQFTQFKIYAMNPETDRRLDAKPVVKESKIDDPIKLLLDPGHYEFVVSVEYVSEEATYFEFEIVEGERTLIDVTKIEFPEELSTR